MRSLFGQLHQILFYMTVFDAGVYQNLSDISSFKENDVSKIECEQVRTENQNICGVALHLQI